MSNYAILGLSPLLLLLMLHSARKSLESGRRAQATCETMFGIGASGTLALMALVHIFELNTIGGWIGVCLTCLLIFLCVLWMLGAIGGGWLALEEIL